MGVVEAVRADLEKLPEDVRETALAALAVALAGEVDDPGNSATSKSMCAGRLIEALDALRALAPVEDEKDGLDDLSARRAARIAAGGAAT